MPLTAGETVLCTTDSFYEGWISTSPTSPLKHLGYKVVTAGVSDILAMNALPSQITVSLGVSSKLPVEALQDLYEGISFACKEQEIDLVGGDTRASMTGLVITVTTLGHALKERIAYRSGAQLHDLICLTGNLGAGLPWGSNCSNARNGSSRMSQTPNRSSRATNTCWKNT